MCQDVSGGVRRCQEVSGGVRRCQEVSGGVRRCQEVSGGVRRCQEQRNSVLSSSTNTYITLYIYICNIFRRLTFATLFFAAALL